MRILLTNDDGIHSPALAPLARELEAFGDVTTIVPDRNRSATSHSLTLHRPLRIHPVADRVYSVDGTPTDCVLIAFHGLLVERPQLVISGINHGPNMGEDVFYSGTVAAALEGALQGVPGMAVSLAGTGPQDFADAAGATAALLRHALARGMPERMVLNINVPARPRAQWRGVMVTRLGSRAYADTLVRKVDPRGHDYYWIGGEAPDWQPIAGTDFQAVHDGWVSVSPLALDLTDAGRLDEIRTWGLGV